MLVNHIWKEPKQGVDLGTTQMIVKELTVQTLGQVSCSDSVKENLRESGKDIKILDMNDMAPIGAALLAGARRTVAAEFAAWGCGRPSWLLDAHQV